MILNYLGVTLLDFVWVIAVSIALGMDAFSFSLALGLIGIINRTAIKLSFIVAVFHVVMPLLGLWGGRKLGTLFGDIAVGIGAAILIWLGLKMIIGAIKNTKNGGKESSVPNMKGLGIYALAGSVSLDALSVGVSLGTFVADILTAVLFMGVTAGLMTLLGVLLGRRVGTWLGSKAEILGGAILLLIGIKMVLDIFS